MCFFSFSSVIGILKLKSNWKLTAFLKFKMIINVKLKLNDIGINCDRIVFDYKLKISGFQISIGQGFGIILSFFFFDSIEFFSYSFFFSLRFSCFPFMLIS